MYSFDDLKGERQFVDLKGELEQACDPATTSAVKQNLLKPSSDDKKQFLYQLKSIIKDSALSLDKDRRIVSTKETTSKNKNKGGPDRSIYGL